MRDIGFNFYWFDPFTENLFMRGFKYEDNYKIDVVTTFESFEHFTDPLVDIGNILRISPNIIFSTELINEKTTMPLDWSYYGFEHGQHISFYSIKTLHYIAQKWKLNFVTNGKIHLFTKKKINPTVFMMFLKFSGIYLSNFIKMQMISKTKEDMDVQKKILLNK